MSLPESLRSLIESGALAHVVTINPDGSPQTTVVWIGLDGDTIISGHMNLSKKLKNVRRDPRVQISLEAPRTPGVFLAEYAVLTGRAEVTEGGARDLLNRLGQVYVAPGFEFPPVEGEGYVLRTTVEKITGVGPWADAG